MADPSPLLPLHSPPSPSLLTPNNLAIASGPVSCILICLFLDIDSQPQSRNMLAVLAWVFLWWLTDAVPMAVTSMAPLFLFPMFGIADADDVAKMYMDDVIALVLGSFILALAVEHYNIHRRLALNITSIFCGDPLNPRLLLLGVCGTTAFVSMWMHNTATTIMMIPVATGILQNFPIDRASAHPDVLLFSKGMILGVVYSAAIGGMSTLTGTGVNLILVGMWSQYFPSERPISFSDWFLFGFPLAVVVFVVMWGILCVMYVRKGSEKVLSGYLDRAHLKRELELLGPMTFAEKMILAVFGTLIFLWMTKSLTSSIPGWGALFHSNVGDGSVSILMATLLFIIPNKKSPGEKLMNWSKCKNLHWNIILLLGAGFAIAEGVQSSGLAKILSASLSFLSNVPYLAMAPSVCLVTCMITEFLTSNNATTTLVLPVLIEAARVMGVHPLMLMIPGAIGAQFAFLLPTATPSNVVGFATGRIGIRDMVKAGAVLKIPAVMMLTLLMPTLGAVVFQTSRHVR